MAELRVKAIVAGVYAKLREPGDEFDIEKEADLGSWMKPVGWAPKAAQKAEPGEGKARAGDDLDALREEYVEVHPQGKKPFPGWKEDELKARIARLTAGE